MISLVFPYGFNARGNPGAEATGGERGPDGQGREIRCDADAAAKRRPRARGGHQWGPATRRMQRGVHNRTGIIMKWGDTKGGTQTPAASGGIHTGPDHDMDTRSTGREARGTGHKTQAIGGGEDGGHTEPPMAELEESRTSGMHSQIKQG